MKKIIAIIILSTITAMALAAAPSPKQGEKIYNQSCAICHKNGVAKAPKVHDVAAWKQRYNKALVLAKKQSPNASTPQLKEKAMDILVSNVKNGLGAMPPRGMCPKCSDSEYKAAIAFMMTKPKK